MSDTMIKKVINKVYHLDYSKVKLESGDEFVINKNGYSDFIQSFKMIDHDNGYVVLPSNYNNGLFYRIDNGGEIFSSPKYEPEITKFSFNILGLRIGKFYRVSVKAKTTGNYTMFTSDRSLLVTTSTNELLIEEDLTDVDKYQVYNGIFCSQSSEIIINFEIGKIYIKDIIIEEVEIIENEIVDEEKPVETFTGNTLELCAYGIFEIVPNGLENQSKYVKLQDVSSHGIVLSYNKETHEYIVERDNNNDTISDILTNARYIMHIDLNKTISFKKFNGYSITAVSPDISPCTLKQGYYSFVLNGLNGEPYTPDKTGRIGIYFYKLN